MTFIEDPASGRRQAVDLKFRSEVHATTRTEELDASLDAASFNFNTGLISLSTGTSGVFYLENARSAPVNGAIPVLVIKALILYLGVPSAGFTATGEPIATVIRNPTGGTVFTDATDIAIKSNNNFGSNLPFTTTTAYVGANGKTLTGGDDHAIIGFAGTSRTYAEVPWVLPFGASLGVTMNPNISSGTCNVYVTVVGFYEAA